MVLDQECQTRKGKKLLRPEEKKVEIVNIYHEPGSVIDLKKAGRWAVVQLVKAFLGMPIVPGR